MRTHVIFYHVDKTVMADAEGYWEKKLPRIEHLLQRYAPDEAELRLTVWHYPDRVGYEARAVLHLPSGTLVADEMDKDLHAAMDAAADTLIRVLKKHNERIRHDDVYRRHRWTRADLSAAGPILERDLELGRHEAFFQLLRPVLRQLRRYAQRELRFLELEGLLPQPDWALHDLMDELVLRAWRRFPERPKHVELDVWLMDLLHEILSDWARGVPSESLEETIPGVGAEEAWWAEPLGYKEELRLEDLVPDCRAGPSWHKLSATQQHEQLLRWLSQLPARQRQAFLLHVLEDYQPFEIAMILDRTEKQVRGDVERARQFLKARLEAEGYSANPGSEGSQLSSSS